MRAYHFLFLILVLPIFVLASLKPKFIYGKDDRIEIYQLQRAAHLRLADAVAAMFPLSTITVSNGVVQYDQETLGHAYPVCSGERFRYQPVAAECTGFLVKPDLIMTAGHCVKSQTECKNNVWIFGYRTDSAGQAPQDFSTNQVYSCANLEYTVENSRTDFAVVRLDRPVSGVAPLRLRQHGQLQVGEELFVIGHPTGLPAKFAGGAKVRSVNSRRYYFKANLDTYAGNSGSPIFNAQTLEVEGILVSGDEDFVKNGSCQISNRCDDNGCRGEKSTIVPRTVFH